MRRSEERKLCRENLVACKQRKLLSGDKERLGSDIDLVVKFRALKGLVATFAASSPPLALFAPLFVCILQIHVGIGIVSLPFT